MIKRLSDILERLAAEEARMLDSYNLKHAPTIGMMYEGLTTNLLQFTLPSVLQLDVVSGFVTDDSGELSPQIDCMIVHGSGEQVPHTSVYKWHVRDVIATFEVKKSLYSAEITDAYGTLRAVMENWGRHAKTANTTFVESDRLLDTFAKITRVRLDDTAAVRSLPYSLQLIFHTLVIEWASPIRIALGYDGFASERNMANAFADILAANIGVHGFGVMGMPQLCVSGEHSIVKMNGEPYLAALYADGWWPILAAARTNPLRLLLELLWSRLEHRFEIEMPWGQDGDDEELRPFLAVRGVKRGAREGWDMRQIAFLREK
jgi:hypothetical protein